MHRKCLPFKAWYWSRLWDCGLICGMEHTQLRNLTQLVKSLRKQQEKHVNTKLVSFAWVYTLSVDARTIEHSTYVRQEEKAVL